MVSSCACIVGKGSSPFFPSVAELQTNPAEFVAFCGDLWWRPRIWCYFVLSKEGTLSSKIPVEVLETMGCFSFSYSSTKGTSYRVTGYSPETTRIDATDGPDRSDIVGIRALFSANCETGETSIDINEEYYFVAENFSSFSSGEKPTAEQITNGDATVTALDPEGIPFRTGVREGETSHCFQYFYGDLAAERTLFTEYEVTPDSGTPPQVSAESDKLSGIGLQFGYRGEKWRASFTHYTGTGGDHELTNSLVIVDYFFSGEFFVGAGIASMQLTNSSSGSSISASATSPVLAGRLYRKSHQKPPAFNRGAPV